MNDLKRRKQFIYCVLFSSLFISSSVFAQDEKVADEKVDAKVEDAKVVEEKVESPVVKKAAKAPPKTMSKTTVVEASKPKAKVEKKALDFYLKQAIANDAVVSEAKANVDFAKARQYRANWAWGPKLTSTTVFSFVPADTDTDQFGNNLDQIFSLDLGPYLRQSFQLGIPLYTFGRIRIAKKLAGLGVDVANLKADQAQDQIIFQTVQAYYGLQLANSLNALLLEGSKLIKKELKKAEDERDFGESKMKTKDFRKLQIFDAEVDGRVLETVKLKMIAAAGLRYLSGAENTNVGKLDSTKEIEPLLKVEEYIKAAETSRPEVEMLRRAEHGVKLAKQLAHRNWYPNIALVSELKFGLSTETVTNYNVCREIRGECVDTSDLQARRGDPFNFSSFTIGLAMRWEFDYWQNKGKSMEADARALRVTAQKKRALGAIDLEVTKLYEDAKEAFTRVSITKRRLKAAKRWRDQFGLAASSGGADIADAVDPMKAFFEARGLHLQAYFDYHVAMAALKRSCGME